MYLLFFLVWIIFNGQVTLEIILFGIVIAGLMYGFICKFMDYSIKKDLFIVKKFFYIMHYVFILISEIVKANFETMKLILSSKYEIEPAIIKFKITLHSKTAKVLLANSITLTPGTITVSLEEDELSVHCLDRPFGDGMSTSIFVTLLENLEKPIDNSKGRKSENNE